MEDKSVYFNDTETSFAHLTDSQIKKHSLVYRIMNYYPLVKMGNFFIRLGMKLRLPIEPLLRNTIYEVFVGGETLEDCQKVVDTFRPYGVGVVPDYSIEGQENEADFERITDSIIQSVAFCKKNDELAPFTVFKMTALTRFSLLEKLGEEKELTEKEMAEYEKLAGRVRRICQAVYDAGISVFFDAEETWIQKPIDDLAHANMAIFNKERACVYNTYQMYRKDGLRRIKNAHLKAAAGNYLLGAKLVRGAYMEKERARANEKGYDSPINESKEATDALYDNGLRYCLNEKQRIWLVSATHNEGSVALMIDLMEQHGIKPDDPRMFFSQLYGMSNNLTFNLADKGYNTVKYLPYGPMEQTVPYLLRRAEENTSAFGQSSRELLLITSEMKRRGI